MSPRSFLISTGIILALGIGGAFCPAHANDVPSQALSDQVQSEYVSRAVKMMAINDRGNCLIFTQIKPKKRGVTYKITYHNNGNPRALTTGEVYRDTFLDLKLKHLNIVQEHCK